MDRQGSDSPQRQSSLPGSLHEYMVAGQPPARRSATHDPPDRPSTDERDDPAARTVVRPALPIPPIQVAQPLPSVVVTPAASSEGRRGGSEGLSSARPSASPAPRALAHDPGAPSRSVLPPLPPPPRGVVRSDPVYYAAPRGQPAAYSVGPPLPPLMWPHPPSPPMAPLGSSPPAREPPPMLPAFGPPGAPRHSPPTQMPPIMQPQPVAGPSRLPLPHPHSPGQEQEPPGGRGRRRTRPKKSQGAIPPQGHATAPTGPPLLQPRRGSSGGTAAHHSGEWPRSDLAVGTREVNVSTPRAGPGSSSSVPRGPPASFGFPIEGSAPIQRPATHPVAVRPPARGWSHSPRRMEGASGAGASGGGLGLGIGATRGGPSSSAPAQFGDEYAVAVGATAYHVTTLLPLRAPALAPQGPAGASTAAGGPPAPAAQASSSRGGDAQGAGDAAAHTGSEGSAGGGLGKRRRRGRGSKEKEKAKESASSESSEHAQAPKSKKTLIACHFCRGERFAPFSPPSDPPGSRLEDRADVFGRDGSPEAALRRAEAVVRQLHETQQPVHVRAAAQASGAGQDPAGKQEARAGGRRGPVGRGARGDGGCGRDPRPAWPRRRGDVGGACRGPLCRPRRPRPRSRARTQPVALALAVPQLALALALALADPLWARSGAGTAPVGFFSVFALGVRASAVRAPARLSRGGLPRSVLRVALVVIPPSRARANALLRLRPRSESQRSVRVCARERPVLGHVLCPLRA